MTYFLVLQIAVCIFAIGFSFLALMRITKGLRDLRQGQLAGSSLPSTGTRSGTSVRRTGDEAAFMRRHAL
ncbi:hypothetical protein [Hoeflea olei]|uniref:Uncharacterized protein n=1 Tax=Hoeflea olei TaxID=1480615 RepID=A0A1C1YSR2_9HYPH|nr:hypothetical protein [Hoeflea olei]OCW56545.1 hypothetical protein AWJ14_16495 [Hoeflea olei]